VGTENREETSIFFLMFAFLMGGERDEISEGIVAFSGKEFHSLVLLFLPLEN